MRIKKAREVNNLDENQVRQTLAEFRNKIKENLDNIYVEFDITREIPYVEHKLDNDLEDYREPDEDPDLKMVINTISRDAINDLVGTVSLETEEILYNYDEVGFHVEDMIKDTDLELAYGNFPVLADIIAEVIYYVYEVRD